MSSRRIIQAIRALFFMAVVGTPLFYLRWGVYPYTLAKSAFFQIIAELIFFFWLALAIREPKYRPKMTPLHWAAAAYLAALTLSGFWGVNIARSFFSNSGRGYGVIFIYHLAAMALAGSAMAREIPWKKLWYASFGTSIATVAIAALQLLVPNLLLVETITGRPGGTFGNPTFLAGYLLLNIFIAGYYLAVSRPKSVFLWSTILVDAWGILQSETRGDLLGLFAGICALVVMCAIRPPESRIPAFRARRTYAAALFLLAVLAGAVWFTRASSVWNGIPGVDRLREVSFSSGSDLQPRLLAYRAAWLGFLERPFTGWGPENFNIVFNKHYDPRVLEHGYAETDFDKPHSVPLELLVSGGVVLLAAYLALLFFLVREARNAGNAWLFRIAVAALTAYFVRSLVIFDTVGPGMMFYLLCAFVAGSRAMGVPAPASAPSRPAGPGLALAALIPAAALIYVLNLTALAASVHSYFGHHELQLSGDPSGVGDFEASVGSWSPYRDDFVRDYANTLAQVYFYNKALVTKDQVARAITAMEGVAKTHSEDAQNHYLLANIYNLASDINPSEYLPAAEDQARRALALSPGRQEILFYLAKTKSLEGDNAAALRAAKQALDLDPNVADAHFYYGMLAFATGDAKTGYEEVDRAIALGRAWHDFYEPRIAGDYFADAGHLPEAIELYRAALGIQPDDLEAEIKLGAAYYLNDQADKARPYLMDAAKRFDFTKSPQYPEYKPILDALEIPAFTPGAAR